MLVRVLAGYVVALAELDVINGDAEGNFNPDNELTRADVGEGGSGGLLRLLGLLSGLAHQGNAALGLLILGGNNALEVLLEVCQLLAKTLGVAASEAESTFPDTTDGYVVALAELARRTSRP